jgi:hypothetical protein
MMAETKSAELIACLVERDNDFAIQRPAEGMDRNQVAAANIASHDFGINAFGITTFPARATEGRASRWSMRMRMRSGWDREFEQRQP